MTGLKTKQKAEGYSQNLHAAVAPVGTSHLGTRYSSWLGSLLNKTVDE